MIFTINSGKTAFVLLFLLSCFQSRAVILQAEEWAKFYDKEVIFYADYHNIEWFEEREKEELVEFIDILKKRAIASDKKLTVLVEHFADGRDDQIGLITSLYSKVNIEKTTIKNIEVRCAFAAVEALLRNGIPKDLQNSYSTSIHAQISMEKVTFNDLFVEHNQMKVFLGNLYGNAESPAMKERYKENMLSIDARIRMIKKILTECKIADSDLDVPVVQLLQNNILSEKKFALHGFVLKAGSLLFNSYLLYSIYDLPRDSQVVVISGAAHVLSVTSNMQIMEVGAEYIRSRGASVYTIHATNYQVPSLTQDELDFFSREKVADLLRS